MNHENIKALPNKKLIERTEYLVRRECPVSHNGTGMTQTNLT